MFFPSPYRYRKSFSSFPPLQGLFFFSDGAPDWAPAGLGLTLSGAKDGEAASPSFSAARFAPHPLPSLFLSCKNRDTFFSPPAHPCRDLPPFQKISSFFLYLKRIGGPLCPLSLFPAWTTGSWLAKNSRPLLLENCRFFFPPFPYAGQKGKTPH